MAQDQDQTIAGNMDRSPLTPGQQVHVADAGHFWGATVVACLLGDHANDGAYEVEVHTRAREHRHVRRSAIFLERPAGFLGMCD